MTNAHAASSTRHLGINNFYATHSLFFFQGDSRTETFVYSVLGSSGSTSTACRNDSVDSTATNMRVSNLKGTI